MQLIEPWVGIFLGACCIGDRIGHFVVVPSVACSQQGTSINNLHVHGQFACNNCSLEHYWSGCKEMLTVSLYLICVWCRVVAFVSCRDYATYFASTASLPSSVAGRAAAVASQTVASDGLSEDYGSDADAVDILGAEVPGVIYYTKAQRLADGLTEEQDGAVLRLKKPVKSNQLLALLTKVLTGRLKPGQVMVVM